MGSGGYNPVTKGSLNEPVNDEDVYRSAPATPCLINTDQGVGPLGRDSLEQEQREICRSCLQ